MSSTFEGGVYTITMLADKLGISEASVYEYIKELGTKPLFSQRIGNGPRKTHFYSWDVVSEMKKLKDVRRRRMARKKTHDVSVKTVGIQQSSRPVVVVCDHVYVPLEYTEVTVKDYNGGAFGNKSETRSSVKRIVTRFVCQKCLKTALIDRERIK